MAAPGVKPSEVKDVPAPLLPGRPLKFVMIGDALPVEAFGLDRRLVTGQKGVTAMSYHSQAVELIRNGKHLLLPASKINYVEFE